MLWKPCRRVLARSLVGTVPGGKEGVRKELADVLHFSHFVRKGSKPELGLSQKELVAKLVDEHMAWLDATRAGRAWAAVGPPLARLVEADPKPPVQVMRDGAAAEAWAVGQVARGTQGSRWRVLASAARTDVEMVKGVKGEADGLLLDEAGLCQAVLEVKIGGGSPYGALYNDLQKMRRLLAGVRGRSAAFAAREPAPAPAGAAGGGARGAGGVSEEHSNSASGASSSNGSSAGGGGGGGGGPQLSVSVPFAPSVAPVYLVVLDDGDRPMEGGDVIQQAEAGLLKVGLSMALGRAEPWQRRDASLLSVDSARTSLRVGGSMVGGIRRRVASEFFEALQEVDVYQVPRPADATW